MRAEILDVQTSSHSVFTLTIAPLILLHGWDTEPELGKPVTVQITNPSLLRRTFRLGGKQLGLAENTVAALLSGHSIIGHDCVWSG